LTPVPALL